MSLEHKERKIPEGEEFARDEGLLITNYGAGVFLVQTDYEYDRAIESVAPSIDLARAIATLRLDGHEIINVIARDRATDSELGRGVIVLTNPPHFTPSSPSSD